MLNLLCALSATRLTGRTVSNEALSKTPDDGLEVGLGILKELLRLSSSLSLRACLGGCRCGILKDVLRLRVTVCGGSSSSVSLSSSVHKPGYCFRKSSGFLRGSLKSSSSSADTVSVRALPLSSMIKRVLGLRASGIARSDPPLERFNGDDRRGMLGIAADPDERESIDDGRVFLKPLSVLLRCKTGRVSKDAFDELVLLREC